MITECPMALLETVETSLKELFCETFQRHLQTTGVYVDLCPVLTLSCPEHP